MMSDVSPEFTPRPAQAHEILLPVVNSSEHFNPTQLNYLHESFGNIDMEVIEALQKCDIWNLIELIGYVWGYPEVSALPDAAGLRLALYLYGKDATGHGIISRQIGELVPEGSKILSAEEVTDERKTIKLKAKKAPQYRPEIKDVIEERMANMPSRLLVAEDVLYGMSPEERLATCLEAMCDERRITDEEKRLLPKHLLGEERPTMSEKYRLASILLKLRIRLENINRARSMVPTRISEVQAMCLSDLFGGGHFGSQPLSYAELLTRSRNARAHPEIFKQTIAEGFQYLIDAPSDDR